MPLRSLLESFQRDRVSDAVPLMFMHFRFPSSRIRGLLITGCLGLSSLAMAQSGTVTIQRMDVLNHGDNFELEIHTSQPITPQTQVVTGPDRLVIDFPNAVPGLQLHPIAVNAQHVKRVRMGLFAANPPVARVVVDLNSPQPYEVFPSGKSVIVKIAGGGKSAAAAPSPPAHPSAAPVPMTSTVAANTPPPPPPEPTKPAPVLQIEFSNGKLRVVAERSTLGVVLHAIARQTGATVSMPPAAEQEPVIANLGPGPARDVISSLLTGVPYNFVLMGSGRDLLQVTSIVLTARGAGSATPTMPANYAPAPVEEAPPEPQPEPEPPPAGQDNPPPPVPDTAPPPQ